MAFRGPIGGSTEGHSSTARMRPPHSVQPVVVQRGAPPKVPVGPPACARDTQYSAPWPHRELQRRPQ
eukprot:6658525-Pyramimonas_sp.AAC.1